jgi:membrane protein DedA with SNARE-associated domain
MFGRSSTSIIFLLAGAEAVLEDELLLPFAGGALAKLSRVEDADLAGLVLAIAIFFGATATLSSAVKVPKLSVEARVALDIKAGN